MITQKIYYDRVQNNNNEVKCPRCGSTSLSVNKRGFIFKKAEIGLVLTILVMSMFIKVENLFTTSNELSVDPLSTSYTLKSLYV